MKFSKKFTNKLVSYADRYFTYDRRIMRREDHNEHFDFFARRDDATVVIDRCSTGIYLCIKKDEIYIYIKLLQSHLQTSRILNVWYYAWDKRFCYPLQQMPNCARFRGAL